MPRNSNTCHPRTHHRCPLPFSPSLSASPAVAYGSQFSVSQGSPPAEQASLRLLYIPSATPKLPLTSSFIPLLKGKLSSHLPDCCPDSSGTTKTRSALDTHHLGSSLGSLKYSTLMVSWSIINPNFTEHFLWGTAQ